ncbi:MAG: trypsin-like serine protease [Myxococcota bacterium]
MLAPAVALASWGCGADVSNDPTEAEFDADTPRIIGGFPANSPVFDAIGALGIPLQSPVLAAQGDDLAEALMARPYVKGVPLMEEQDTHFPFCSGSLIAPNAVLTAEHCVDALSGDEEFLIGFDGTNPDQAVRILGVVTETTIPGGFIGLGSDLAVAILETPVVGVDPVGFGAVSDADVGGAYIGVGYGVRNNNGEAGLRYLGQMNLLGVGGNHALNVWGTFEEYAAQFVNLVNFPPGFPADVALPFFDLIDEYEATFGGAPGNAQACFGDSGGPALRLENGELTVYGVTSGGVGTDTQICDWGGVYATMGPKGLDLINAALACELVPEQGMCDGVSTVTRCKPPIEGGWEVVETDCSLFGLVCGEDGMGGLTCVPDPCEGLPEEGTCDGDTAVTCSEPGDGPRRVIETDCAAFGGTCGFDEAGEVMCDGILSCEGNCGGFVPGPDGQFCFCDEVCSDFGDCCDDYVEVCEGGGGSEGGGSEGGESGGGESDGGGESSGGAS